MLCGFIYGSIPSYNSDTTESVEGFGFEDSLSYCCLSTAHHKATQPCNTGFTIIIAQHKDENKSPHRWSSGWSQPCMRSRPDLLLLLRWAGLTACPMLLAGKFTLRELTQNTSWPKHWVHAGGGGEGEICGTKTTVVHIMLFVFVCGPSDLFVSMKGCQGVAFTLLHILRRWQMAACFSFLFLMHYQVSGAWSSDNIPGHSYQQLPPATDTNALFQKKLLLLIYTWYFLYHKITESVKLSEKLCDLCCFSSHEDPSANWCAVWVLGDLVDSWKRSIWHVWVSVCTSWPDLK